MLYQDNVLKENWIVEKGELYVTGPRPGQSIRRSNVEISLVIWPEKRTETTKRYLMAPITMDVTGKEQGMDIVIRSGKDIGRPFTVMLSELRLFSDTQLLRYVGRVSPETTAVVTEKVKQLFAQYCNKNA